MRTPSDEGDDLEASEDVPTPEQFDADDILFNGNDSDDSSRRSKPERDAHTSQTQGRAVAAVSGRVSLSGKCAPCKRDCFTAHGEPYCVDYLVAWDTVAIFKLGPSRRCFREVATTSTMEWLHPREHAAAL
jgi:hypothetical protein